jgi:hypothetical protein
VPRKGAAEFGSPLTFLTPTLEVNVGRVAMLVRLLLLALQPSQLNTHLVFGPATAATRTQPRTLQGIAGTILTEAIIGHAVL